MPTCTALRTTGRRSTKSPRLDQCGQCRLPHPVVGGESLEGGPFRVVVVVDVHVGERSAALREILDQLAGGRPPPRRVVSPERPEPPVRPRHAGDQAEEEEEAHIRPPERVALEVEEDVTLVGLRA